jgi:hypothetical protein
MEVLHRYLEFLWSCFQYDIEVFSKAWIYYYLLIPAIGYFVFFILKWIVLTAPVWLPVTIIVRVFNLPSPKCEECVYKTRHEYDEYRIYKGEQDKDTIEKPQSSKLVENFPK